MRRIRTKAKLAQEIAILAQQDQKPEEPKAEVIFDYETSILKVKGDPRKLKLPEGFRYDKKRGVITDKECFEPLCLELKVIWF